MAIVLVVLVVAAIIGLATYSRVISDTRQVTSERMATEADQLSSSIAGSFVGVSSETIENLCASDFQSSNTCKRSGSIGDMGDFLANLTGLSLADLDVTNNCNQIDVEIVKTSNDEQFSVVQDSVIEINTREMDTGTCAPLTITFSSVSDGMGVVLSKIYGVINNGEVTEYKPYEDNDMQIYCFGSANGCVSDGVVDGSLGISDGKSTLSIGSFQKSMNGTTYKLLGVRVHPFGGDLNVSWNYAADACSNNWYRVSIGAICGDAYSGKKLYVPDSPTAPSLFDYVFLSNSGPLEVSN